MAGPEYPQWSDAWRAVFPASKPFGGNRILRSLSPPLLMTRVIVLRTGLYLTLLFVLAAAVPGDGGPLAWILVFGTAAWAAAVLFLLRRRVPVWIVRDKDPAVAVAAFVSMLVGFAGTPAWVGFIGVLFGGGAAPYGVAMLMSFGLLAASRPSHQLVARVEATARRTGDGRDFHTAMLDET